MIPEETYDEISDNEPSRHNTPVTCLVNNILDTSRDQTDNVDNTCLKAITFEFTQEEHNTDRDRTFRTDSINKAIHNSQTPESVYGQNETNTVRDISPDPIDAVDNNCPKTITIEFPQEENGTNPERVLLISINKAIHNSQTPENISDDNGIAIVDESKCNIVNIEYNNNTHFEKEVAESKAPDNDLQPNLTASVLDEHNNRMSRSAVNTIPSAVVTETNEGAEPIQPYTDTEKVTNTNMETTVDIHLNDVTNDNNDIHREITDNTNTNCVNTFKHDLAIHTPTINDIEKRDEISTHNVKSSHQTDAPYEVDTLEVANEFLYKTDDTIVQEISEKHDGKDKMAPSQNQHNTNNGKDTADGSEMFHQNTQASEGIVNLDMKPQTISEDNLKRSNNSIVSPSLTTEHEHKSQQEGIRQDNEAEHTTNYPIHTVDKHDDYNYHTDAESNTGEASVDGSIDKVQNDYENVSKDEISTGSGSSATSTQSYSYTSISSGHTTTEQTHTSQASEDNSDDEITRENGFDDVDNTAENNNIDSDLITVNAAMDQHDLHDEVGASFQDDSACSNPTENISNCISNPTIGADEDVMREVNTMSEFTDDRVDGDNDSDQQTSETAASDAASYDSDFDSESETSANLTNQNDDAYEADFEQQSLNSSSEHNAFQMAMVTSRARRRSSQKDYTSTDDQYKVNSENENNNVIEHTELDNPSDQTHSSMTRSRKIMRLSYKERNKIRDDMSTQAEQVDPINDGSLKSTPLRLRETGKSKVRERKTKQTLPDIADNSSHVSSSRTDRPVSGVSLSSHDSRLSKYSHTLSNYSAGTINDVLISDTQLTASPGFHRPPHLIPPSQIKYAELDKRPVSAPNNESHTTIKNMLSNNVGRPPSGRSNTSETSAVTLQTKSKTSDAVKRLSRPTSETSLLSKQSNYSIGSSVIHTNHVNKTETKTQILRRTNSGSSKQSKESSRSSIASSRNMISKQKTTSSPSSVSSVGRDSAFTDKSLKVHSDIVNAHISGSNEGSTVKETKPIERKSKKSKRPNSGNVISSIRKLSTASLPPIKVRDKHSIDFNFGNTSNANDSHDDMLYLSKTNSELKASTPAKHIPITEQRLSTQHISDTTDRQMKGRVTRNKGIVDSVNNDNEIISFKDTNNVETGLSESETINLDISNRQVSESTISVDSAERKLDSIQTLASPLDDADHNKNVLSKYMHSPTKNVNRPVQIGRETDLHLVADHPTPTATSVSSLESKSEILNVNNDIETAVVSQTNNNMKLSEPSSQSQQPKDDTSRMDYENRDTFCDETLIYEEGYLVSSNICDNEQDITYNIPDRDMSPDAQSITTTTGNEDNKTVKSGNVCMSDIARKSNETLSTDAVRAVNSNTNMNEKQIANTPGTRSSCFRSASELVKTSTECSRHLRYGKLLKKSQTFHNVYSKKKKDSPVRINTQILKKLTVPTENVVKEDKVICEDNTSGESITLSNDIGKDENCQHTDDSLSLKSNNSSMWLSDHEFNRVESQDEMILRSTSAIEGSRQGRKLFADRKRPSELADLARLQDIRREFDLQDISRSLAIEKHECRVESQDVIQISNMRTDAVRAVSGILHDIVTNVCSLGKDHAVSLTQQRCTVTDASGTERLCCIIQSRHQDSNARDVTCDVINPLEVAPVVQQHEILLSHLIRLSPDSSVSREKEIVVAVPIDETHVTPWHDVTARSLDDSGNWKNLGKCELTKTEENGHMISMAEVRIDSLETFAIVARPVRDVVTVGTDDVSVTSSVDRRVQVQILGKKLSSERQIIVQVIPIDVKTLTSFQAVGKQGVDEGTTLLAASPLVVINVSGPSSDAIQLTVPCIRCRPRRENQPATMTSYLQVSGAHLTSPYLRQRAMGSRSPSPRPVPPLPRAHVSTPDCGADGEYNIAYLADRPGVKLQRLADSRRHDGDNDLLSFPICNRDTRFIVLETKRSNTGTEVDKLAKTFSEYIDQKSVTIRITQDTADVSTAHLTFSPADTTRKERFQFNYYNKTEVKVLLHEGETIYMKFRGNVTPTVKHPCIHCYHTCHGISKTFNLKVIDHFGQRSLVCYHGKLQIYTMKDRRLAGMDNMTSPDVTSGWELRAELTVLLPKLKPKPPALVKRAPIALKFEEPLSTDFLKVISTELVKDWIKFSAALKVNHARIQAIRQQHRNVISPDVIMDIILCWMKRQPVSADKVRPMVRALRACRKWRLVADLTARQKAVYMFRSQTASDDQLKAAIALVCKSHIATERWRHIYHQLCSRILGSDVIDDIKDIDGKYESEAAKCYSALCMWRESTKSPSLWKLVEALKVSNCTVVADTVIVRSSSSK